jgi:hypothetical protein
MHSSEAETGECSMFTIKFYSHEPDSPDGRTGYRQRILSAESFTILRNATGAEITLHQRNPIEDYRVDIGPDLGEASIVYQKAIIENSTGKTTEIIAASGPLV